MTTNQPWFSNRIAETKGLSVKPGTQTWPPTPRPEFGAKNLLFINILAELYEHERNWTGGIPSAPLDPPMTS